MLEKRIIPCLDINKGRVVKGVNFVNLIDAGDPAEVAREYYKQGADEIVFLDISATNEDRGNMIDIITRISDEKLIPITVGGGIRNIDDFEKIIKAGASKVSINSAAIKDKNLISSAAKKFGKQCVVVAIDVKRVGGKVNVVTNGGRIDTGLDAVEWALEVEKLGAGEILLTSMDADGTKNGYDIDITKKVSESVKIPVTASGGCGKLEDFLEVFQKTQASAALAASIFHFKELTIPAVKDYLKKNGILTRE